MTGDVSDFWGYPKALHPSTKIFVRHGAGRMVVTVTEFASEDSPYVQTDRGKRWRGSIIGPVRAAQQTATETSDG